MKKERLLRLIPALLLAVFALFLAFLSSDARYAAPARGEKAGASVSVYRAGEENYLTRSFQASDRGIAGTPPPGKTGSALKQEMSITAPDLGLAPAKQPEKPAAGIITARPEGETAEPDDRDVYYIRVNRSQNTVTVYERDEKGGYTIPVRAMICSAGTSTPTGVFRTSDKYEWHELYGRVYGQYATRITEHILFHSVPYTAQRKNTLEYREYNRLGSSVSKGCIRLTVADAKWIHDNCAAGTRVEIYDGEDPGPLGKPEALCIDEKDPRRGWDPTDPDPENPWLK